MLQFSEKGWIVSYNIHLAWYFLLKEQTFSSPFVLSNFSPNHFIVSRFHLHLSLPSNRLPLIFIRPRSRNFVPENLKCEVSEIRLLALFRAAQRITQFHYSASIKTSQVINSRRFTPQRRITICPLYFQPHRFTLFLFLFDPIFIYLTWPLSLSRTLHLPLPPLLFLGPLCLSRVSRGFLKAGVCNLLVPKLVPPLIRNLSRAFPPEGRGSDKFLQTVITKAELTNIQQQGDGG